MYSEEELSLAEEQGTQNVVDENGILWEDWHRKGFFPMPAHKYWIRGGRLYRQKLQLYKTVRLPGKRGAAGETVVRFDPHFARDSLQLFRITDTSVRQTILGKLVHLGSVTVYSSDRTTKELTLHNIRDPERFCDWFDDLVNIERERKGLNINEFVS